VTCPYRDISDGMGGILERELDHAPNRMVFSRLRDALRIGWTGLLEKLDDPLRTLFA